MAKLTPYDATIEKRQAEMKKKFLDILREIPIIEVACKKAGIGRTTYYRWRELDSAFADASDTAWRDGIEYINDMSETQMIQLIKEKKLPAINLWLKHNSNRYRSQTTYRTPPVQRMPTLVELVNKIEDDARRSRGGKEWDDED